MKIDYDEIRRIHRLERSTTQLADVDTDFLESLRDFFLAEKKRFVQEADSLTESKSREFANLRKMIDEIVLAREKKLLNKALAVARTGDALPVRIAAPEKKILQSLVGVLNEYAQLMDVVSNGARPPPTSAATKDYNSVAVRILKDIPAFVGSDDQSYGPFLRSTVVEVPPSVADTLLRRKLAETP
jgi:DNA replication initiation complex subunit (GINS family)